MADFCQQCSIEIWGKDHRDLASLCLLGEFVEALCEGCGPTYVDGDGKCVNPYCEKHGEEYWRRFIAKGMSNYHHIVRKGIMG